MHALLAAVGSFTGPIVPDLSDANGNLQTCAAGFEGLTQVVGGILGLAISLGILIAVLVLAYGGFLLVLNPVNPENRGTAKKILTNAAIGFIITLSAWLVVNTFLNVLGAGGISGATKTLFGGGSTCLAVHTQKGIDGGAPGGTTNLTGNQTGNQSGGCPTGQSCQSNGKCGPFQQKCGGNLCGPEMVCSSDGRTCANPQSCTYNDGNGGDIAVRIANAASAYIGTDTSQGPDHGRKACAWAVNNVLSNAGLSHIDGDSVSSMESALKGGRGTAESQSAAVAGDIVIEAGDGHVGICLNTGCSNVISNSSSNHSFTWKSGPDFYPSYHDGIGRFYRVNN